MEGGFFNTMQMRILGALLMLMVMIALGSYASLNFEKIMNLNPSPATITVTGEGEVLAVPDVGEFSFSVRAETKTAATAQEQSAESVNKIIAYLKAQGVEEKDIQTQNYNLSPTYHWEERVCEAGVYCGSGERVQDGFSVNQTVLVKVRDTAKAGTLISGVGEQGATNISSLSFAVDDVEKVRNEARAKAIANAKEKAGVLVDQLGVRVVRIAGFSEGGGYRLPYQAKTLAFDAVESEEMVLPDLPVGEQSTKVQVTIVYEVK